MTGRLILVSQDVQPLAHRVRAVFDHGEIHASVGIQIIADDSPAIKFLRHSEQESHVFEACSRPVEQQNLVFKSIPREFPSEFCSQFSFVKLTEHGTREGGAGVEIVAPEFRAVVLRTGPAEVAVGNIEIRVAIEVEIRRGAAP